jgi:hypothetical protein
VVSATDRHSRIFAFLNRNNFLTAEANSVYLPLGTYDSVFSDEYTNSRDISVEAVGGGWEGPRSK